MNTCSTCKFWNDGRPTKNKLAACGEIDVVDDYIHAGDDTSAQMKVSADDDSGMDAKFITGRNFGCTLHSHNQ